ncbi:MAG: flagellar hook-length control protein FliK [Pseudomonadota bacterium]
MHAQSAPFALLSAEASQATGSLRLTTGQGASSDLTDGESAQFLGPAPEFAVLLSAAGGGNPLPPSGKPLPAMAAELPVVNPVVADEPLVVTQQQRPFIATDATPERRAFVNRDGPTLVQGVGDGPSPPQGGEHLVQQAALPFLPAPIESLVPAELAAPLLGRLAIGVDPVFTTTADSLPAPPRTFTTADQSAVLQRVTPVQSAPPRPVAANPQTVLTDDEQPLLGWPGKPLAVRPVVAPRTRSEPVTTRLTSEQLVATNSATVSESRPPNNSAALEAAATDDALDRSLVRRDSVKPLQNVAVSSHGDLLRRSTRTAAPEKPFEAPQQAPLARQTVQQRSADAAAQPAVSRPVSDWNTRPVLDRTGSVEHTSPVPRLAPTSAIPPASTGPAVTMPVLPVSSARTTTDATRPAGRDPDAVTASRQATDSTASRPVASSPQTATSGAIPSPIADTVRDRDQPLPATWIEQATRDDRRPVVTASPRFAELTDRQPAEHGGRPSRPVAATAEQSVGPAPVAPRSSTLLPTPMPTPSPTKAAPVQSPSIVAATETGSLTRPAADPTAAAELAPPDTVTEISQTERRVEPGERKTTPVAPTVETLSNESVRTERPPGGEATVAATRGELSRAPAVLASARSAAPLNLRQADWSNELMQRVEDARAAGLGRLEITINPRSLGPISVELQQNGDGLTVQLTAGQSVTRELLEQTAPRLRDALDGASVHVAREDGNAHRDETTRDGRTGRFFADEGRADTHNDRDTQATPGRRAAMTQGVIDTFA